MSSQRRRGSRRVADVLARATAIYERLIQGDATRDELVEHVRSTAGRSIYGASPEDSLRHDLDQLALLGFEVRVISPGHLYRLAQIEPRFPLPLAREHVETLAAVRRGLAKSMYAETVEGLVARLRPFLPHSLRPLLDREPLLRLGVPLLDDLSPHMQTAQLFRKAQRERRRFAFTYTSPAQPAPLRHTVEPEGMEERDGHVYFEGYSPDIGVPLQFRLDRVEAGSAEVLPSRFAEGRARRPIRIRYRLSPVVARLGATRRFEGHVETPLPDGWVEVGAETLDLFWAGKTLLKYGEHCVVLEPPELVAEMKRVVGEMARNYGVGNG